MSRHKPDKDILTTTIHMAARNWHLALLFVLVATVTVSTLHQLFPRFQATAALYIKSAETSPILSASQKISGYSAREFGMKPPNASYIQILESENLITYITEQLKKDPKLFRELTAEYHFKEGSSLSSTTHSDFDEASVAEQIVGNTRFKPKDDELIEITVFSSSPEAAALGATRMARLSASYLFEYEAKEVADIERFLSEKIDEVQTRISENSISLEQLKSKQSIVGMSEYGAVSSVAQSLAKLKDEQELVQIKIQENESLLGSLRRNLSPTGEAENFSESNLRGRSMDRYRLLQDERVTLEARTKAIAQRIAAIKTQVRPEDEEKISQLSRKIQAEYEIFRELKRQLSDINVYRIAIGNRILNYRSATNLDAEPPTPLKRKLALTLVLSLGALFVGLYLWAQLNPTVTNRRDLEFFGMQYLGNLPLITSSPSLLSRVKVRLFSKKKSKSTHWSKLPLSKANLAFQFLRTRLVSSLNLGAGESKVIAFASARPSDGKSFSCVNLAMALGKFSLRTLIVDCDIMKTSSTRFFDQDQSLGLTDVLAGEADAARVIVPTSFENVSFLPAGKSAPDFSALAHGDLMVQVHLLRSSFDVILLDLPALQASPEAAVLCRESDDIVFVADAFRTRIAELAETLEHINPKESSLVLGLINRLDSSGQNNSSSYYVLQQRNSRPRRDHDDMAS